MFFRLCAVIVPLTTMGNMEERVVGEVGEGKRTSYYLDIIHSIKSMGYSNVFIYGAAVEGIMWDLGRRFMLKNSPWKSLIRSCSAVFLRYRVQ